MQVSWLKDAALPAAGRLCLTHTPGAAGTSRDADLDALVGLGIDRIICLQQPFEFAELRPPETLDERTRAVLARGMAFVHEPIEDFGAPSLEQARGLTRLILQRLAAGELIAMHCWAGLGRAGTIAACTLIETGYAPRAAVRAVRSHRPGSVQSAAQLQFIDDYLPV